MHLKLAGVRLVAAACSGGTMAHHTGHLGDAPVPIFEGPR
jgi:hypothetical protein